MCVCLSFCIVCTRVRYNLGYMHEAGVGRGLDHRTAEELYGLALTQLRVCVWM
jgi:hypothetical protein